MPRKKLSPSKRKNQKARKAPAAKARAKSVGKVGHGHGGFDDVEQTTGVGRVALKRPKS